MHPATPTFTLLRKLRGHSGHRSLWFAGCAACALAWGLLVATAAHAAPPPRSLEFWTMQLSPSLDDYVLGVISSFEAANPGVKIKWVDLPWGEMERKVLTAIAAKAAPDVVNMNPQFAAKLAEFRALADPEQYLSPAQRAAYLPAAWQANRLDGRSFALPWYLSTNLTLYNTALLKQAGVSVPETHAELLSVAPAIKAKTEAFAYFPALDGSTPLETLVAMGADLQAPNGCGAGFITAQGEQAFDFYRTLYTQGLTPRNVVTEGHRKAIELFLSGQVAIVSSGMQFLKFIQTNNPAIYATIEVAPQLLANGRQPSIAAMNLAVTRDAKDKTLAFAFAQHVTSPAQQLAFAKRVPILPSTRASYDDPFFAMVDRSDLLGRARAMSVAHVLRGEVVVPPMRNYNKLRNGYARQLQAYMLGRKPLPQVMSELRTDWAASMGCTP